MVVTINLLDYTSKGRKADGNIFVFTYLYINMHSVIFIEVTHPRSILLQITYDKRERMFLGGTKLNNSYFNLIFLVIFRGSLWYIILKMLKQNVI